MLRRWSIVLLLLSLMLLAGCAATDKATGPGGSDAGFVPLFDGASLAGWEGPREMFRIEDGAIVGGTLNADIPHNAFLCTTETYGDFELRLQFKLLGEQANAGVQFRSRRVQDHYEVSGYQADMGQQYWGCLYDESRRNRVLAGPSPEKIA